MLRSHEIFLRKNTVLSSGCLYASIYEHIVGLLGFFYLFFSLKTVELFNT